MERYLTSSSGGFMVVAGRPSPTSGHMRRNFLAALVLLAVIIILVPLSVFSADGSSKTKQAKSKPVHELTAQRKVLGRKTPGASQDDTINPGKADPGAQAAGRFNRKPTEHRMQRARSWRGDLRSLPFRVPRKIERPEREEPEPAPSLYQGGPAAPSQEQPAAPAISDAVPALNAPAPPTLMNFDGLDFANWGAGHPPDTNGDVGPTYYIQTVNTSIGIYDKATGTRVAAFTFDTFMSQGNFGNLCDTDNFGDPVVLYDSFEDRWIITDFAFQLDSSGNVVNPPGSFQCIAVSKTGDPVAGGWNFYSINTAGGLGDYPKFGIWPDGLYMTTNMFDYAATGAFQNPRAYAFNKAQMYAGSPTVQVVSFDMPAAEFTVIPSNARLQTGTPPPGTPNYYLSTWLFTNAVSVYKFHVDWNSISLSTFTGPDIPIASTSWPNQSVPNAVTPSPGNSLDTLQIRAMMQLQYTNLGGAESLWATQTVRRATGGFAAPRWYQVNVTGGTVAPTIPQAATWDPNGANVVYRYMPSLAVNSVGDMALGYTTSNSTTYPTLSYAGRLSTDPVNTFSQTEQLLWGGTGTQTGTCGGTCSRWGDYSAMTLDPDGCTFWYTNEYYAVNGLNDLTRIGSFRFPTCAQSTIQTGTISGTVTDGSNPISGATVTLGTRTATTDGSGFYSLSGLPAGTYPTISATKPGYSTDSASSIAVTNGGTTTKDFVLTASSQSNCLTDTTQPDFLLGVATTCDLNGTPGSITLLDAPTVNQQNVNLSNTGVGVTTTTWGGQTFTPSVTAPMTRVDINFFCSACTGTAPNLTVSLRATSAGLPTGADLATATLPGSNSASGGFVAANFSSPPTLTAGTQYALVIRPTVNPSVGGYFLLRSTGSTYAGGTRVSSTNSGGTWTAQANDAGFKVYLDQGFPSSGNFVSSVKDANPVAGTPTWGTITWNATVPAGTALQFQAAASNNPNGPFNFVGPDTTSGTFFSSGGSLSQFTGNRYLKYKAFFSSTNTALTPTLNDVTICFSNVLATSLAVDPASGSYGGTATLTATLTTGGNGIPGKTVDFTLNSNPVGSALTDPSGVATLTGVSLASINAGSYPGAIGGSFAGDATDSPASGTSTLTVSPANQTITFGALPSKTFGDPDFNVSATASSGLTVSFAASGNCMVTGTLVHLTGAGSCTITASQPGDANYNAAPDVPQAFSIGTASQTITFGPLAGKTFGDPDFNVSATASSGLTVSFGASGNCTVTGTLVHLTGAGSCTITASQPGNANYSAATPVPQTFNIAKANQTITFGVLASKTIGDPDFNVSAIASSGLTVSFGASGNCTVTGTLVHLTGVGSCTITASQAGNTNYNAAPSVPRMFNIAALPPVALVHNVTVDADASCTATASINNGSYDPGGFPITLTQTPPGPYGVGTTHVTLTVANNQGRSSQAAADVFVRRFTRINVNATTTQSGKKVTVKLTATVTSPCGSGAITGNVLFTWSGTASGSVSVPISGGTATYTLPVLNTPVNLNYSGSYGGDATNDPIASSVKNVQIF